MPSIRHLLNQSLDVWRATVQGDGMGGQTTTWVQVGSIKARLSQPSAQEREVAAHKEAELTQVIYALPGADVVRGDELHGFGTAYVVLATFQPSKPAYLRIETTTEQVEAA